MHKNTLNFIKKVFILSTLIIIIFNIGYNYLNASTKFKLNKQKSTNSENYKPVNSSNLGPTGVAISTNLGTSFTQINNLPATIYKEIFSISDLIEDKNNTNELIGKNMIVIKDYLNVLKTDVKKIIDSSYNKSEILNAYIEQLEFRYVSGVENQKLLTNQKQIFVNSMNTANSKIEAIKLKIEKDFKNSDSKSSLENIEEYLKLKQEYYYAKTYIIYINHFLAQYNFLNSYSKDLAALLINNKEAIIKDAFVVVPDSGGIEALKNFELIFNQSEIKQ